jgi:hypothetical protein
VFRVFLPKLPGWDVLSTFFEIKIFVKKRDRLWGVPPVVAPEGGLGFRGESRVALDFIQKLLHIYSQLESQICTQKTWKSFLRVKATLLLDIPSTGEDFALLVR